MYNNLMAKIELVPNRWKVLRDGRYIGDIEPCKIGNNTWLIYLRTFSKFVYFETQAKLMEWVSADSTAATNTTSAVEIASPPNPVPTMPQQ